MARENSRGALGLQVEIDSRSGFCYGVIRAIDRAESYIKSNQKRRLSSLGSIVHNSQEVQRLREIGMDVVTVEQLKGLKETTILIRAHGEPPSTYKLAQENNIEIIDCTCPVLLKLQKRIREGYKSIKSEGGTLLIFGKKNHAEVNGLLGQVDNDAVVVETLADLAQVDLSKPVLIFSQTTKDVDEYNKLIEAIERLSLEQGGRVEGVRSYNTICTHVSSRHPNLKRFAAAHSVLIFISGKESSNGKVLFESCREVNIRSYKIESYSEIDSSWFKRGERVGVCGATSTPSWQLEEVARYLESL